MTTVTLMTRSPQATIDCGRCLGELLRLGDMVFLEGDIGAGKTTLCKGIALGLGVQDEITSPTFTLISEYEGRVPLAHMDLYRLQGEADMLGIGVEDYLRGDTVVLVEWPGELRNDVDDVLSIHVRTGVGDGHGELSEAGWTESQRFIDCTATGRRSESILQEWVKRWQS